MEVVKPTMIANKDNVKINIQIVQNGIGVKLELNLINKLVHTPLMTFQPYITKVFINQKHMDLLLNTLAHHIKHLLKAILPKRLQHILNTHIVIKSPILLLYRIMIILIKLHRINLRKKIILVLMEVVKLTMIANKDNVKINIQIVQNGIGVKLELNLINKLVHTPLMTFLNHIQKAHIHQYLTHLLLCITATYIHLHLKAILPKRLQLTHKTQIVIMFLTLPLSLIIILLIKIHRIKLRKKIILVLMEVVKPTMIANKDNVKINIQIVQNGIGVKLELNLINKLINTQLIIHQHHILKAVKHRPRIHLTLYHMYHQFIFQLIVLNPRVKAIMQHLRIRDRQ